MTNALILLDFQRGMTDLDGIVGRTGLAEQLRERGTLNAAAEALAAARAASVLVVHVRLAFADGYANRTNASLRFVEHEAAGRFRLGSAESEFTPELAPADGEIQFIKGSVGAFASTPLGNVLRARGVQQLALAGVATHLAVESTARDAVDRGFTVTVIADACAAPAAAVHEHAIGVTLPGFAEVIPAAEYSQRIREEHTSR